MLLACWCKFFKTPKSDFPVNTKVCVVFFLSSSFLKFAALKYVHGMKKKYFDKVGLSVLIRVYFFNSC